MDVLLASVPKIERSGEFCGEDVLLEIMEWYTYLLSVKKEIPPVIRMKKFDTEKIREMIQTHMQHLR